MRLRLLFPVSLAAFLACASSIFASVMSEGEPPFWFAAQFMGPPAADGTIRIGLSVGGFYDNGVIGKVRLSIPPGLKVISGETLLKCKMRDEDRVHTLVLRPKGPGTYVIHGSLVVHDVRIGVDESELEVGVVVQSDTIIQQACRVIRQERVNDGHRYRFGESVMIPIEKSEQITQDQLLTFGKRPSVVHQEAARCLECPQAAPKTVKWVVFLDSKGNIRDMRPLAESTEATPEVAASREALHSWTFSPATLSGRGVSDFIVVDVPVNPSR
jgi:hypothetical protein